MYVLQPVSKRQDRIKGVQKKSTTLRFHHCTFGQEPPIGFCFGTAMPQAFVDRVLKFHSNLLLLTTTFMDDSGTHIKNQNGQSDFSEEVLDLPAMTRNDHTQMGTEAVRFPKPPAAHITCVRFSDF